MKKYPWFKMYPSVWLADPHVRHLKWDAKGLLADLMCIAHDGTPRGSITNGGLALSIRDIAKTFSESVKKTTRLMTFLLKLNRIGQTTDGIWFIPSMVRETEQLQQASDYGKRGWEAKQGKTLKPTLKPTLKLEVEENRKDVDVEKGQGSESATSAIGKAADSPKKQSVIIHAQQHKTEKERHQADRPDMKITDVLESLAKAKENPREQGDIASGGGKAGPIL